MQGPQTTFPNSNFTSESIGGDWYDPFQHQGCYSSALKDSMAYKPRWMRNWSNAFGAAPSSIDKDLIDQRFFFETDLIGTAKRLDNEFDYKMPTMSYRRAEFTVGSFRTYGLMAKYTPRKEARNKHSRYSDKLFAMNDAMMEAEDRDGAAWYLSNPIGGWENGAMFRTDHSIIANRNYCVSNIMPGGYPDCALAQRLHRYGQNFVSHEQRPSPRRIVQILSSPTGIDMWEEVFNSEDNRVSYRPNLIPVNNISNASFSLVFYEGWANSIFMQPDFLNRVEETRTVETLPQTICVFHMGRWRYFYLDPRLVVLVGSLG